MRQFSLLLVLLLFIGLQGAFAQRNISGTVTSSDDGKGLPGVTVLIKNSSVGTITDANGKYTLAVPQNGKSLVFSFIGMKSVEVVIGSQSVINAVLSSEAVNLEGVVVTALGITREKKSLGYASQEVKGDNITAVRSSNFMNSLSGKVSGVQIKKNTNMGGSTNVVMRGSKSLTNSNQVLYVVDGVPINNQIGSYSFQNEGDVGYDYGNAASDINSDNIESVNILKGSAATALYGSRASGGVIMITTKKGKIGEKGTGEKQIGITFNSNVVFSSIDKSTFPTYQNKYGAGYGAFYGPNGDGFFERRPVNGVLQDWVPTTEDASYGAKFDGHPVYGWYSVDKQLPWYGQSKPWLPAVNGPITFFNKPSTLTNTLSIENSGENGSARLSYTNFNSLGLLPNSTLKKDNFFVTGTWNITNKLTATATADYTKQSAVGRNSTGYNDNILTSMRQWIETNVDYQDQKTAYLLTKRNIPWNYGPNLDGPIYWDNPYWTRYENFEDDNRSRIIGNMSLNYKITDWLSAFGRVSEDTYNEYQGERRAVGSVATTFGNANPRTNAGSGYLRRDIIFSEYNFDFMLNIDKKLGEKFNLKGVLGANERRTNYSSLTSSTNGGLNIPGVYSLQNSVSPLIFPNEIDSKIGVRSFYASASLSYKSMLYLDGTFRSDYASTLPVGKNKYYYPSVTGAFIFSELVKKNWLSFGKIRLNYAQVGNLAGYDQLLDKYVVNTPFNNPSYSLPATKNNPDLKNESTNSVEGGLEMNFFNKRLGFDLALYKTNSKNQIMPITLSQTTGYNFMYVNAGEIENKGLELNLNGIPIQSKSFKWDIDINFSKNKNKVISLYPGIDNLQLGSFQGGITLNASIGQAYQELRGTDYTYDANGNIIINATTGKPVKTATADHPIGNANPDWIGGIRNSFSYKNLTLSFLIDIQHGGDIYSLDMYYGLSTGIYPETAGTNDLGNPVRDPVIGNPVSGYDPKSGGYIIKGVNVANGVSTPNKTRVDATSYSGWGYAALPNKAFIYDASYVKLREVALSYTIPSTTLKKFFIKGAVFSVVGSNLWIIHKNLPYADPESGLAAGNVQGYSVGSLPSTRDFGFNVKLNF